ncbi:MAG TPA: ribonuclease P protein component [Acholeplasmataceae bacterium]|jgi:ribonuclease P protein component|nr:ribonuclease P protein component [Acholeplasmataceae bacterium]
MNRKYSLKKNHEIAALFKNKVSVGNRYYVIYYKPNTLSIPRIAISVSKKYGKAVTRNYEKRVTREILRNLIQTLPNYDFLVIIKKGVSTLKFSQKKDQLQYLINKIIKTGVQE